MENSLKIAKGTLGFWIFRNCKPETVARGSHALDRALRHFPSLKKGEYRCGSSTLKIWSHQNPENSIYRSTNGSLYALVGSPLGIVSWATLEEKLGNKMAPEAFSLPWEGRVILLKINPEGSTWMLWNDWIGSIPVFHAEIDRGHMMTTLEPILIPAAGYTTNDIFLPGLISLLLNGHYVSDWTLYRPMKTVHADSFVQWDEAGFSRKRLWTIKPSDERWDKSWKKLREEMHEVSRQVIAETLESHSQWILPLSSGLDSRFIAAVSHELGSNITAYTYGPRSTQDVLFGEKVARSLNIPWRHADLGTEYLVKYLPIWAEWFGSALHFHGMYQLSFLQHIDVNPKRRIIEGFLGEALMGGHLSDLMLFHRPLRSGPFILSSQENWSVEDLSCLMRIPIKEAVEVIAATLQTQINGTPGAWFQKLMFLDFWNRQRCFIFYQPMMYDYWCGVSSPFLNRRLARFCLSLPYHALVGRRLQKNVFRHYYPRLAEIPGDYGVLPMKLTFGFFTRHIREWNMKENTQEADCIRTSGRRALWPIDEVYSGLSEFFRMDALENLLKRVCEGGSPLWLKHWPIQTIAFRMLSEIEKHKIIG